MSFTDEELRVLERMCESGNWPISGPNLLPLLARLKAAEKAICLGSNCDRCKKYVRTWRRSKGD